MGHSPRTDFDVMPYCVASLHESESRVVCVCLATKMATAASSVSVAPVWTFAPPAALAAPSLASSASAPGTAGVTTATGAGAGGGTAATGAASAIAFSLIGACSDNLQVSQTLLLARGEHQLTTKRRREDQCSPPQLMLSGAVGTVAVEARQCGGARLHGGGAPPQRTDSDSN